MRRATVSAVRSHHSERDQVIRRENSITWRRRRGPLNMNHYANKKSAAESMLDVALLMANASQLKAVLEHGPSFTFYVPLITLLSISLILQIVVGVMLIFIVKWNLNDERMHHKLDILESCVMAFIFVIVVVNVFITAFGVQQPHSKDSPPS
ncbi:ninjurin-1 isoform X2 [Poeciliopsis prolifica]|uniref:ninjurin-1 isoform X2 n=1 Tax=Poeciliopsis prolifica TaxID=188132 RepID=UPI002412FA69|nr:ninjurin-1 isoform X2 [Poeciliopsis prolifica]